MPKGKRVLLVALSARSLAAAARRAGYVPLVADLFCDDDTRVLAEKCERIGTRSGAHWREMDPGAVLATLQQLAEDEPVSGVVYGTGFENDPDLIDAIAARWPLRGNDGGIVARLKKPESFARMCRDARVAHPEIWPSMILPRGAGEGDHAKHDGGGREGARHAAAPSTAYGGPPPPLRGGGSPSLWLVKKIGGSGGSHIRLADTFTAAPHHYLQRHVDGRPVSALFLADGARARIVGFSEQWTAPTLDTPFRYGGAVQPADLSTTAAAALAQDVESLVAASGVVGLCSADFLLEGERAWCLELNPRPGATLDIFDCDDAPLFAAHLRACRGDLPTSVGTRRDVRAAQIVYAEREIAEVPTIDWPEWAADRQPAGSVVALGEPLCTVLADAPTREEAQRRLRLRADAMTLAASGRAA